MLENKTVLAHYLFMVLKKSGIEPDNDMHVEINGIIEGIDDALEGLNRRINNLEQRANE